MREVPMTPTLDELIDRMADIDAWGEKKEG